VVIGLWISWYASTAAGATIALAAALSYFVSALTRAMVRKDPMVHSTSIRQADPAASASESV
jgi:hypothetical protein